VISANVLKDAEMNRAGMNGYRTPASKKAKKEVGVHYAQWIFSVHCLVC